MTMRSFRLEPSHRHTAKWLALLALALTVAVWCVDAYLRKEASKFDPIAWRDATRGRELGEVRFHMVGDLLTQHRLEEMTRDQVLLLLGPPTQWDWDRKESGVMYYLGPEHRTLFRIDSDWLDISFDLDGRVITARVRSD